jgi:serine/threonine protein kinase
MLTAGSRLGPYEIVSSLGAGGMGEVYRARDTRLGRDVAIKILPDALASDAEMLARFEREAKAVAALSHPNILTIFDVGRDGKTSYAVMELLEGETLRQALSRGALPVRKVIDYAVQMASGLWAAHQRGIIHRDLKPENAFVTRDGRLKILDFGLARAMGAAGDADLSSLPTEANLTEPGTIMGTIAYMSPEQVRGQRLDARSDIFSFGTVLFEMITGRRVFAGETSSDVMSAILRDDPPELPDSEPPRLPAAMPKIVHRCLEKDPNARFQTASDLAFQLSSLQTLPTGSSASGRTARIKIFPVLPKRVVFALLAAIGLAAGAALIGHSIRRSPIRMARQSRGPATVTTGSLSRTVPESSKRTPEQGSEFMQSQREKALSLLAHPRFENGRRVYAGELVYLDLVDANVRDVAFTIAELTGLNIAVDPGTTGSVSIHAEGLPWDEVIDQVVKQNKLAYRIEGSLVIIGRRSSRREAVQRK